jgi:hypothetical protein
MSLQVGAKVGWLQLLFCLPYGEKVGGHLGASNFSHPNGRLPAKLEEKLEGWACPARGSRTGSVNRIYPAPSSGGGAARCSEPAI